MKLTLLVSPEPVQKVFDTSTVTLGSSAELADLLSERFELQPEHIRIVDEQGHFLVINLANDPFVTLNGRPFGKKSIRSGDRLNVCGIEIIFDGTPSSVHKESATMDVRDHPLMDLKAIEKKLYERLESRTEAPTHEPRRQESPPYEEDVGDDIAALLEEVDQLESEETKFSDDIESEGSPEPEMPSREWSAAKKESKSLSAEWVDPSEKSMTSTKMISAWERLRLPSARHLWRPAVVVGLVIFALLLTLFSGLYFTFAEQTDEQEYAAAQGVADVAMALTFADMHQIKPANQNWSDPDFLQSTLNRVLPSKYPSMAGIDAQGNFKNSPYLLRIYTSNDLSQFVLVAQPSPSLWHWFSRRRSIVLDSLSMELRITDDLRELNRLLANNNALEGSNAAEIEALVRGNTQLMRLSKVASESGHREFMPPKALAKMRPGAENLVYNAPRYYRFTEPVAKSLAALQFDAASLTPNTEQLRLVTHHLAYLAHYADLVLYADGQVSAEKAEAVLAHLFPQEALMVGYLKSNGDAGIINVENSRRAPLKEILGPPTPDSSKIPGLSVAAPLGVQPPQAGGGSYPTVLSEREKTLQPYSQQILLLLAENNRQPVGGFYQRLSSLVADYRSADNAITQAYVSGDKSGPAGVPEEFSQYLNMTREAQDLYSLDQAVTATRQWLKTSNYQEESATLPSPMNRLQMHAQSKLDEFLSYTTPLSSTAFQPRNRSLVINILNNAGIRDTNQRDFYLQQFDLLVAQHQ